jgi:F-type H+-transporting ATPase subunit epsilon
MRVTLISPDRSVYDGEASAVVVPAYDGLVGILPGHAPFLALLGRGEVTLTHPGGTGRFTVDGGFVQVAGDVVRVVAERADETIKEAV